MPADIALAKVKAASVAVVVNTLYEMESASRKPGSPDDPGRTFVEIFDWRRDDDGTPYWSEGPNYFRHVFSTKCFGRGPFGEEQQDT